MIAQAWVDEIKAGRSMSDIMQAHQIPEGMIWKRIRLAYLSPKLLQTIVEGTTNRDLSIKMLTKHDLPVEWSEQTAKKKTPQKAGPVQQGVWHWPLSRDRVQPSFGKTVSKKKRSAELTTRGVADQ